MFPFTLYCNREKGWSEYTFRDAFLKNKPKEATWYGYDVVVESPTRVTFLVYGMMDFVYGGCDTREHYSVSADVPVELTAKHIGQRAWDLACALRQKELEDTERKIIIGYANEYLTALNVLTNLPDDLFAHCWRR